MTRPLQAHRLALLALVFGVPVLGLVMPPHADADGRKGRPAHVAPPVPPLRMPPPSVKPPTPLPPPVIPFETTSREITLPADFGTGGVGADINGGSGGGRIVVIGGGAAYASASASAFAFASARSGGGHKGGHGGKSGGCGGCR